MLKERKKEKKKEKEKEKEKKERKEKGNDQHFIWSLFRKILH
jgi:hypothetical protein